MSASIPTTRVWPRIAATLVLGWPIACALAAADEKEPRSAGVQPPGEAQIPRVQAKQFEIHFQTSDPEAVRSIELWYTLDCARTWRRYEPESSQRTSPISFIAPYEGLYGLFVIVVNQAGASSPPPTPGTQPHQWCFVDWIPPLVQLHVAQRGEDFDVRRLVALKWTAHDAHLTPRPVDLHYMVAGDARWIPIELRLPNSGRYDWRVPDALAGDVVLKLSVRDRGGHVVERFSERIGIDPVAQPPPKPKPETVSVRIAPKIQANQPFVSALTGEVDPRVARRTASPATTQAARVRTTGKDPRPLKVTRKSAAQPLDVPERLVPASAERPSPRRSSVVTSRPAAASQPAAVTERHPTTVAAAVETDEPGPDPGPATEKVDPPAPADTERAKRLYKAGTYYRLRGQYGQRGDLAIAALRFQEALRADPTFVDARQDLAGVLFLQGKYAEAAEAYQALLSQWPNHRGALQGLALTMVQCREYESAKTHLMRLVGLNPNDGEAWLDLGDVYHKIGNLKAARDAWGTAASMPNVNRVTERARRRLATYTPLPLASP